MTLFLVLVGVVLVYLLQNSLYEKYWSSNLLVSVEFDRKQATKGDKVNLVEVITNNKILPLLMVRLKFIISRNLRFLDGIDNVAVSDLSYKQDVFSLLFYQRITRTIPFVCDRRGFYTIEQVSLVSTNLFLNMQFAKNVPVYTEITVFPRLADASKLEIPFRKIMGEMLSRRYLYEDPFEFRSIREYSTNDTMSSINWKATARTGDFKVNVHDYTSSQEVCILLNVQKDTQCGDALLVEECISIAAGLADKLLGANVGMGFVSNGRDLYTKDMVMIESGNSGEHMESILTSLARIDLELPTDNFEKVILEQAVDVSDNTLYVMVSAATNKEIQNACEELAGKSSGVLWIVPYNYKLEHEINLCTSVELLPWEVNANER